MTRADDWGHFAEPSPKLGEAQLPKCRARKVTLTSALKQADRVGRLVKTAEVYRDHVLLTFEPDKEAIVTALEAWKAKRNARQT